MNKSINESCQVWWCTPVIPAFRRQGQENGEFETNLGCVNKTLSRFLKNYLINILI
jgi:hypothetical protein